MVDLKVGGMVVLRVAWKVACSVDYWVEQRAD